MGKTTLIEWTNKTWNPWQGCKKISAGCLNCYMYRAKNRYGQDPQLIKRSSKTTFYSPLKWNDPSLIFTCSWSDWFIEEADPWREEAWDIIQRNPHHIFQILTKRPERIAKSLPPNWGLGWDNVWLGVTIENQQNLSRFDYLLDLPSKFRFISAEPLLGPLFLHNTPLLDWVIVGGESGPKYRSLNLDWVREIRNTCTSKEIPFYYKQLGGTKRIDGTWGGRDLDGRTWDQIPNNNS
jgi:protein gp37